MDAKASLFYLPVAIEEVLRYFSNEFNKKISFTDFQRFPNSFLIHIQLDHMLKPIKDTTLESSVVVSPIIKYFLRPGKSLKDLELDLISTITSVIESENYSKISNELEFNESEEHVELAKGIKFIHVRYKNWLELSRNIQSTLKSYIKHSHFDKEGVFRFSCDKDYEKNIRLTYKEYVGVNSFYIEDLEKVKYNIKYEKIGKALKTYLALDNWETLKTQEKE